MSRPAQEDVHADAAHHLVELADGDARLAQQLLAASGLGPGLETEEVDFAALRTPDTAALALARLVDDEDVATVYELFQLAGYGPTHGWGEALLLAEPSQAPDPARARRLLHHEPRRGDG